MKNRFLNFSFKVASFTGKILCYIWPMRLSVWIDLCVQKIHTERIVHLFKNFGTNSSVHKGVTLIGSQYISIGNDVGIMKNATLTAWDRYESAGQVFHPEISIGNGTIIGQECHITAINKISIGNNVLCGRCLTVTDNGHGTTDFNSMEISPRDRPLFSKGVVIIEDNVWLGDKVTVLPGVTIGKNSIIGANAVVTKDIPPYSVVCGNPGRIIRVISNNNY